MFFLTPLFRPLCSGWRIFDRVSSSFWNAFSLGLSTEKYHCRCDRTRGSGAFAYNIDRFPFNPFVVVGMKLPAACSLLGAFAMPWVARSCSVSGDWQETTPAEQWAAASYVVFGAADGLSGCGSLSADQQYKAEDAALFNASGLCVPSETGYLVLVRNVTFTKGSVSNCSEIVVGGFGGRSACSVDPPGVNSTGTFFLCNVVVEGGVCKGTMNQEGNIHLGFVSEAVSVPASTLCPQD